MQKPFAMFLVRQKMNFSYFTWSIAYFFVCFLYILYNGMVKNWSHGRATCTHTHHKQVKETGNTLVIKGSNCDLCLYCELVLALTIVILQIQADFAFRD